MVLVRKPALCFLIIAPLTACIEDSNPTDGPTVPEIPDGNGLLAIGDSIFEWNIDLGASIPEVAGEESQNIAVNAAIGGSWLTGDASEAIPAQRIDGDWSWLVFDGGGNDLNDRCGCGDCATVLDELITADGTSGVIVEIVQDAVAAGTRVIYMGYPELPPGAEFGFDRCDTWFGPLAERVEGLANTEPRFWFVDASDVVKGTDDAYFIDDHVHPSPEGSRVMGAYIADTINANR